jgi:hypothetical protein
MKANPLVLLLLFLMLGVAVAQQPTVKAQTNVITPANSDVVVQPHTSPKYFHDNASAQIVWPENLEEWIGIVQGLSVIVASVIAWRGINAWRKEFVGKLKAPNTKDEKFEEMVKSAQQAAAVLVLVY